MMTEFSVCDYAESSSLNLEPLRDEEALLLNILNIRWNRRDPLPPVWNNEASGPGGLVPDLKSPNQLLPFHYCIINKNQFFLCSNSFDCKCEHSAGAQSSEAPSAEPSFPLIHSTITSAYPEEQQSRKKFPAKMGLSKEVRLQRRPIAHLAKQLKNNCDRIFDKSIPFVVDFAVLRTASEAINSIYKAVAYDEEEGISREDLEYQDLVMFLSDFFQQSPSLCISLSPDSSPKLSSSPDSLLKQDAASTTITTVDISYFKNLQLLELRNTPPKRVQGLGGLRSRIKKLKCSRSLHSIGQILSQEFTNNQTTTTNPQGNESCSSRSSSSSISQIKIPLSSPTSPTVPCVWPELTELDFSFNKIGKIDEISTFELCPSLQVLNLSRNKIVSVDDRFSRVMSRLSTLNLSYNQLTSIPSVPPTVKILLLSHNYITSMISPFSSGHHHISSYTSVSYRNLEVLDLSTNLISKEADLVPLKELNFLKKLNLVGNPLSFLDNYRTTAASYLNRHAISRKFELDKKTLSSSEVRAASEQSKQGKFIPFIPATSLIISPASAITSNSMISSSSSGIGMHQSSSSSRLDQLKSMTQSYDSSSSSVRSCKRKKPKIREITTFDYYDGETSSSTTGESSGTSRTARHLFHGDESCKENYSEERSKSSSSSSSLRSADDKFIDSGSMLTGQAIASLRKKYGPENWLLRQAGGEVGKILHIPERPINLEYYSRSLPSNSNEGFGQSGTGSSSKFNRSANPGERYTNEELIVLANPRRKLSFTDCSEREDRGSPQMVKMPSEGANINREVEDSPQEYYSRPLNEAGQERTSIFDLTDPEPIEEKFLEVGRNDFDSFKIFKSGEVFKLVINDGYLLEVNPGDSVILNRWDLNSLFCLEEERCDGETETVEFRLKFDTMRKQMRERSFIMVAKDFTRFDKLTSPYVEERTLQEFTEALQCTRCYDIFSRAAAGRTVKVECGVPAEISICPNPGCSCEVLVTLDNIPLPNNEILDLDLEGPMRASTPISGQKVLSRSIPKERSPRMFEFFKMLPSSLTSTRNAVSTTKPCDKETNCFDNDEFNPGDRERSETSATPSSSSGTVANTKSESDIEVLSNDSSSIEVLTRNCGDSESDVDAEEALELPTIIDAMENKSINKTIIMSESTSSSSCADSIVTTYERNLLPISQPLNNASIVPSPSSGSTMTAGSSFSSFSSTSTLTTKTSLSSPIHSTCIPIRYNYVNFSRTDHRLELWCDISVFKSADERLLALTKCMVISDSSSTGTFLGIVIFSSKKVYFYRITGNEGDKPQDWLQKVNAFDLPKFTKLDVLIGRHGIGVDFSGKYFGLVFRDSERTSNFLEYFMSDMCGEMDQPPMVRDFSQTQKAMLSPTNPISYFGIMRYAVCETDKPYSVAAILLTNEELLLIADLSWMAGRCDTVSTKHGRTLSTLRQVESMETDDTFIRLVFEVEPTKLVKWELSFETPNEKSVFEKLIKVEAKSSVPFICLSQPLEA